MEELKGTIEVIKIGEADEDGMCDIDLDISPELEKQLLEIAEKNNQTLSEFMSEALIRYAEKIIAEKLK